MLCSFPLNRYTLHWRRNHLNSIESTEGISCFISGKLTEDSESRELCSSSGVLKSFKVSGALNLIAWTHCVYNKVIYFPSSVTNQSMNDRREQMLRLDLNPPGGFRDATVKGAQ